MKRFTRQMVNTLIEEHRFIPLFNPDRLDATKQVIEAAYRGGVRLFELTNRSPESLSVFQQIVPFAKNNFPDLCLGAGTILTTDMAKAYHEAGAAFIIAPIVGAEVGSYCRQHDLFWIPGAATLTEIVHAHELGADLVKIFPANFLGGPGFVQAIKAPCPWLRLMPTGGVDGSRENLTSWFSVGVTCVGIGSQLFKKEWIQSGRYDLIESATNSIVTTIKEITRTT